ncbi:MAG: type IV secretion system protein [Betaproteobacteria bacterium]|nr:hypothetical protein [Rhodocyclaceae bacterium]MCE2721958.1 type IV secretion system protein [Betaproteobacteria bacterium]
MTQHSSQTNAPPTGAPPAAFDYARSRVKWFDRSGGLLIDRNRYFLLLLLALVSVALLVLFAFKAYSDNKAVPYILSETEGGGLKSIGRVAEEFKPLDSHKRFFARRWLALVRDRESIRLTESNLKVAWAMTRGKAQDEFRRVMQLEQPLFELQKDPTLSVRTDIVSVAQLDEGVYFIRFKETRSSQSQAPVVAAKQLTLRFVVETPTTDEERDINPIGFYVTSFDFKEEKL